MASGLRVTRSSGDPGAGSHIQIRGPVTITSLIDADLYITQELTKIILE